jgi:hypothetical protein
MVARRWSGFDVPDDDVTNTMPRNMPHVLFKKLWDHIQIREMQWSKRIRLARSMCVNELR